MRVGKHAAYTQCIQAGYVPRKFPSREGSVIITPEFTRQCESVEAQRLAQVEAQKNEEPPNGKKSTESRSEDQS